MVGVDAGITSLVTLSTGEKVTNPRHERADRERLAKAQRNLARKAKGSANRAKARLKVARVHARIADRRRDHLHKLSTRLVRENQAIVIEDLHVRNMVRNHCLARADLRRGVAGPAGHAGVQVRLVRPGPGGRGPLVPVAQGVLGVRLHSRGDAAERPGVDLHQLRCDPRPGRERGAEPGSGRTGRARLWRRSKTNPTVVGEASVATPSRRGRKQETQPARAWNPRSFRAGRTWKSGSCQASPRPARRRRLLADRRADLGGSDRSA